MTQLPTKKYGDILSLVAILDLLENRDPEIKVLVIERLARANDIVALKLILDAYEKEQDPLVQAAYKKYIPVIQERYGK